MLREVEAFLYVCFMLINDVILEIKNYSNSSLHKSALDIFNLLESNQTMFLKKMDPIDFKQLHIAFENLAYANPNEYQTIGYEREYQSKYALLLFYLDRIV
jgi:hypothetical protein